MKDTSTTFKGCCATCVTSLVWHEVWGSKLIYHGFEVTNVVGSMRKLAGRESPRAFCKEHSAEDKQMKMWVGKYVSHD